MHQGRVVACDESPVVQLDCSGAGNSVLALAALDGVFQSSLGDLDCRSVLAVQTGLVHDLEASLHGLLGADSLGILACRAVVAPDDLLVGSLADNGIIADAETKTVDAHVGRRVVAERAACDLVQDSLEKRISLHVAVVVYGDISCCSNIIMVNLVVVADIGRGGLVGDVHRMVDRQVPDRERLELGIAGLATLAELVIDLGKTGGELSASRARSRDDDNLGIGRDVGVGAVALVADDHVNIVRVAHYGTVEVDLDSAPCEHVGEVVGASLSVVPGDYDLVGLDAPGCEVIDHLEDVRVVRDSEIRSHLAVLDVSGMDADDDVQILLEGLEDLHLVIGVEPRKNPGCMVVEKKLSAAFDV